MPWFGTKIRKAQDQLSVMEQSADDRLADAELQHAAAQARQPKVGVVHKTTQQLRNRNRWGSLVEDVWGGR